MPNIRPTWTRETPPERMKTNNVKVIALAVFFILAGSFTLSAFLNHRVSTGYEAELAIKNTTGALRSLQINIRALQSERANLRLIMSEWEESRATFDKALHTLDVLLRESSFDLPQLRRMANTWGRMESLHVKVRGAMDTLDRSGLLARVGNSSLVVKYQELLSQKNGRDAELAELSLLIFYLEHADRMVQEIEIELESLDADLHLRTSRTSDASRLAASSVLLISLLVIFTLLLRIARLYSSVAADNAARKEAEQAARDSEADLRITLNAIGDAVIVANPKGRIIRMNPAAEKLLGLRADECLGHAFSECCQTLHPETKAVISDPVSRFLGEEEDRSQTDYLLVLRDGSEHSVSSIVSPVGRSGAVVLVFHDLTHQRRMEEQVRRSQRIESIGQLAGGVAHDFNNLLQVIKANLSFVQESGKFGEDEREYFQQIEEAVARATELTRQLLALGRRQTMRFRELDPRVLIKGFLGLVRRVLGEHIEIVFDTGDDIPMINGDAGQLEQVLLNLCVNARDAMPEGGRLCLSLSNHEIVQEELREWPMARPGRFVRIMISDTGHGMDAATLNRLFEPFFTTKALHKGSGLGLSVVQGIIQQHGGIIRVESTLSVGTTVTICIPVSNKTKKALLAEDTKAPSGDLSGRNELVLLVEDETPVRLVATAILRRNGYRVVSAADGEDACQVAKECLDELAIAILDVVMPRMGGIEAARELQRMKPGLPIVLCTGYAGGTTPPELNQESGWKLINKPYHNQELLLQVRRSIDLSRKQTRD